MQTSKPLIVAGVLFALTSCTCERKTELPQKRVTPVKKTKRGKAAKPLPSLKDQMRKMQRFTEEIRRRVRGNVTVVGPARVVRATIKSLPINRYPKNFKIFYNSMVARTEAMIVSKDVGRDFNKLVDRCIACHALHAQDYMGTVRRLKLSKDQWPKGPPPETEKKGTLEIKGGAAPAGAAK